MSDNLLLTDINDDGVATITLNRPDIHNAFDDHLIEAFLNVLQQWQQDTDIRVLQLKANGKSFSAGADMNWMQRMANYNEQENVNDALQLSELMRHLYQFNKPTIAVMQGSAFGGGVGLAACCDIVIANESVKFCLSETKLGLIPAAISPYVITKIGRSAAKRYFLTAELFDVQTAHTLGLVHEVVAANDLEKTADKLTKQLLKNSPAALAEAKQLIDYVSESTIDFALSEKTAKHIARLRVSAQGQEGLNAFLEKRTPNWTQH